MDIDKISILLTLDGGNMTYGSRTLFVKGLKTIIGKDVAMMVVPYFNSSDGDVFSIMKRSSTVPDYLTMKEVVVFHKPYTVAIKRQQAGAFVKMLEEMDVPCRVVENPDESYSYLSYLSNLSISWGTIISAFCKANVTCVHIARWGQKWTFGQAHLRTAESVCSKLMRVQSLTRNQTNFGFRLCSLDIGITQYVDTEGTYPQWTLDEDQRKGNLNYRMFPLWNIHKECIDGGINYNQKYGALNENSPLDGIHENVKCYINSLHVILNYKKHGDTHCHNIRDKTVAQLLSSLDLIEKVNDIMMKQLRDGKVGYRYEHSFKNKNGVYFSLNRAIKRACHARLSLYSETGVRRKAPLEAPPMEDVHQRAKCLMGIFRLFLNRRRSSKMKDLYTNDTIEMLQGYLCELFTIIGYNNGNNSRKYYEWLKGKRGNMDILGQQRAWRLSGQKESAANPTLTDRVHRESFSYPVGMNILMELVEDNRRNQVNEQDDMEQIDLVRRLNARKMGGQCKFQTMTTFPKLVFLRELAAITAEVFWEAIKDHAGKADTDSNTVQHDTNEEVDGLGGEGESDPDEETVDSSHEGGEQEMMTVADMVGGQSRNFDGEEQRCCCCSVHRKNLSNLRMQCLRIKSTNPNLLKPCLSHEEFLRAQMPDQVSACCFFESLRCVRRPDECMETIIRLDHGDGSGDCDINSIQFWRTVSSLLQERNDIRTAENGEELMMTIQSGSIVDAVWWPTARQHHWLPQERHHKPWYFDRDLIKEVIIIVGDENDKELDVASLSMDQIGIVFSRICNCGQSFSRDNEMVLGGATEERVYFNPIPVVSYDDDPEMWGRFKCTIGPHLKRLGGWSKHQMEAIELIDTANGSALRQIKKLLGLKRKHREPEGKSDLLKQIAAHYRCGELSQETSTMMNWHRGNDEDSDDEEERSNIHDLEDEELQEQQETTTMLSWQQDSDEASASDVEHV